MYQPGRPSRKRGAAQEVDHPQQPMKNPSRERMKAEIAFLRDQLAALENFRWLLEAKHNQPKPPPSRLTLESRHDVVHPMITQEYQVEYEKRRAAEQENTELRVALSQQLKTVKDMITRLRTQAVDKATVAAWLTLERLPSLSNVLHDENGYRFSVLSDSVDRFYRSTDSVIQFQCDNEEHPREFVATLTSCTVNSHELLMLEGRETGRIPFDFEHSHKAMWKAIETATWRWSIMAFEHKSTPDTLMLRIHSVRPLEGGSVNVTSSMVVKRFMVETDRMVVVMRAITSLDGLDEDSTEYVDETGWWVMQQECGGEESTESVIVKSCMQWTPRSFSVEDGDHAIAACREMSPFTNLIQAASCDDTNDISELMESLLIADCMSD